MRCVNDQESVGRIVMLRHGEHALCSFVQTARIFFLGVCAETMHHAAAMYFQNEDSYQNYEYGDDWEFNSGCSPSYDRSRSAGQAPYHAFPTVFNAQYSAPTIGSTPARSPSPLSQMLSIVQQPRHASSPPTLTKTLRCDQEAVDAVGSDGDSDSDDDQDSAIATQAASVVGSEHVHLQQCLTSLTETTTDTKVAMAEMSAALSSIQANLSSLACATKPSCACDLTSVSQSVYELIEPPLTQVSLECTALQALTQRCLVSSEQVLQVVSAMDERMKCVETDLKALRAEITTATSAPAPAPAPAQAPLKQCVKVAAAPGIVSWPTFEECKAWGEDLCREVVHGETQYTDFLTLETHNEATITQLHDTDTVVTTLPEQAVVLSYHDDQLLIAPVIEDGKDIRWGLLSVLGKFVFVTANDVLQ